MKMTELEKRRIAKGWSLNQLRNLSGVDRGTIQSQEEREWPKRKAQPRVRAAIAAALGVEWQELYTVDGFVK